MKALIFTLLSSALLITLWLTPSIAMALSADTLTPPTLLATLGQDIKATTKDAEGKLESALGELTGDAGMKIKGEVKQGQAVAMGVSSDIKRAADRMH
ncbi:MAG: CsbD family protein [Prochlorococcaceae cyanobacterium]|jgi:uncharacterized protein YjbJ (UPF0337 family)